MKAPLEETHLSRCAYGEKQPGQHSTTQMIRSYRLTLKVVSERELSSCEKSTAGGLFVRDGVSRATKSAFPEKSKHFEAAT